MVERRAQEPMLPLPLFKNRMVLGMMLACLCQGAIMFSAIAYLPVFSTAVLGQANSNGNVDPHDVFFNRWCCFVWSPATFL